MKFCKLIPEFIVGFTGYYKHEARRNFIRAALRDIKESEWSILPRNNILKSHPSDFDVIRIKDHGPNGLFALTDHPNIKTVTPHRKVTRTLKFHQGEY